MCWLQLVHRVRLLAPLLDRREVSTPTAAEIKKNIPELWVRKAKTFFAFFDNNGDGIMNIEDYRLGEKYIVETALANNVSDDHIQKYKAGAYKLWVEEIGEGEDFQWTENKFL